MRNFSPKITDISKKWLVVLQNTQPSNTDFAKRVKIFEIFNNFNKNYLVQLS